jgi:carbon storage regulator
MLVLSRRPGETIVIGGTIRVTVLGVRGNQVRLGFTAPAEVVVTRAELGPLPGASSAIRIACPSDRRTRADHHQEG